MKTGALETGQREGACEAEGGHGARLELARAVGAARTALMNVSARV